MSQFDSLIFFGHTTPLIQLLSQHIPPRSSIVEGLQNYNGSKINYLIMLIYITQLAIGTCSYLLQWSLDRDDLCPSNGATIARIFEPPAIEH